MDFTKFVSLLETQALWFSKPALLGDPWELAWTHANLERLRQRLGDEFRPDGFGIMSYRANLASMFVNCWHLNDGESAAMWSLYLSSFEGVAVQSTWGDLTGSIGMTRDPVVGGLVRYVDDFHTDPTDDDTNLYFPVTTKRQSFRHEAEVRLVTWWTPDRTGGVPDWEQIPQQEGIPVPLDLTTAVHRVVLCPGSPAWFKHLVHRVATRYSFGAPIQDSVMDDEPTHL